MQVLSQPPRDPVFVQDPYPFYDRARAAGPLFLWEDYGFPCAAGFDAVNALLRDRRFGREPVGGPPERPAHLRDFYALDYHGMLDREPPAHTRLRGLVLRAFTARLVHLAPTATDGRAGRAMFRTGADCGGGRNGRGQFEASVRR
jgi:cytochrome P450